MEAQRARSNRRRRPRQAENEARNTPRQRQPSVLAVLFGNEIRASGEPRTRGPAQKEGLNPAQRSKPSPSCSPDSGILLLLRQHPQQRIQAPADGAATGADLFQSPLFTWQHDDDPGGAVLPFLPTGIRYESQPMMQCDEGDFGMRHCGRVHSPGPDQFDAVDDHFPSAVFLVGGL